jgi:predicted DNA repair protein MutK
MAGASLLALLDDIATILDDVAVMTKVAAKKTAGVLGDDLALNAQQVAGVRAERELPVVWAVGVGSLKNKLILVPAALAISALLPAAITPLLMVGGLYLCFEGVEKLAHKWLHSADEDAAQHAEQLAQLADPALDLVALEKEKIGARSAPTSCSRPRSSSLRSAPWPTSPSPPRSPCCPASAC